MRIRKPKNRAIERYRNKNYVRLETENCDPPSWDELITHPEAVRSYAHQWDRINLIDGLLYRSYADTDKVPTWQQIMVPAKLRGNFLSWLMEG